ncbi:uncharacterized protein ACR2FA_007249 [Aphomia sociella]
MRKVVMCLVFVSVSIVNCVELDVIDCGIDHSLEVRQGDIELTEYPWLGILYYSNYGDNGENRAVTTVALIQEEFVVAAAADIGPMPKHNFRANSRVLLGEDWAADGRRVRNYILHPEYGETYNTLALVQLRDPVRDKNIKPLCPPPDILRNPEFYVVKFKDDFNDLKKEVIPVSHVPRDLCRDFYITANLYAKKMRPPHVACAVSLREQRPCVWEAGAALTARDVWGRWQLLGLGVRGPGCGAPSRYLDMMSYYPWLEVSLRKFRQLTISKVSSQKYVLRTDGGSNAYQRFGNCDEEEKVNLVYRDAVVLRTDNNLYQFLTYNMTIYENVEYSCLTLELVNASATSEMRVKHFCPREGYGTPCYHYKGSTFEISVYLMFSDRCTFEMFAWGWKKNMTLLDIQEWKWEEGTYYEDFSMTRSEYRGPSYMTEFGYEPLDEKMWVPEYDIWTTTEYDNDTRTTTPTVGKEAFLDDEKAECLADSLESQCSPSTLPMDKDHLEKVEKEVERIASTPPTDTISPVTLDEVRGLPIDEQFGFRAKHSSVHQVHRITEHALSNIARKHTKNLTGALFFDVAKAFDKVWHSGLIYKLHHHGVPDRLVHILRDYLSNRTYRYRIKGACSNPHPVRAGIPQGSVLAPTLFSLYTNDIPRFPHVEAALFADDTAYYTSSTRVSLIHTRLQKAADKLGSWFRLWRIEVNPEKSAAILFTRRNKMGEEPVREETKAGETMAPFNDTADTDSEFVVGIRW